MEATPGIDPRAVIGDGAQIGVGVSVGPFSVIGTDAIVGDRCRLGSHVVVDGSTEIGPDNVVSSFASLGGDPQDLKYRGEPTKLVVGASNRIHEFVTLNRGTESGGGVTRVGDENLLMAYVHVAHDCQVGSRTIFGNAATLGGHAEVGDDATVGAFSGVHQFCRIARHAFIGGYSVVTQDALPWVLTVGNRAKSYGLNTVGLKRKGYSKETMAALKTAYTLMFRSKKLTLEEAMDRVESEHGSIEEVRYFLEFVRASERGVCR